MRISGHTTRMTYAMTASVSYAERPKPIIPDGYYHWWSEENLRWCDMTPEQIFYGSVVVIMLIRSQSDHVDLSHVSGQKQQKRRYFELQRHRNLRLREEIARKQSTIDRNIRAMSEQSKEGQMYKIQKASSMSVILRETTLPQIVEDLKSAEMLGICQSVWNAENESDRKSAKRRLPALPFARVQ